MLLFLQGTNHRGCRFLQKLRSTRKKKEVPFLYDYLAYALKTFFAACLAEKFHCIVWLTLLGGRDRRIYTGPLPGYPCRTGHFSSSGDQGAWTWHYCLRGCSFTVSQFMCFHQCTSEAQNPRLPKILLNPLPFRIFSKNRMLSSMSCLRRMLKIKG